MARYIDVEGYRKLFDEEYKKTRKLIYEGETYLDNLAKGFYEASRVIDKMPTAEVVPKSEVAKTLDELIEAAGEIADSYKKEADSMSYSDFSRTEYRGTQIGALLVQYKIAELKKKYTEQKGE